MPTPEEIQNAMVQQDQQSSPVPIVAQPTVDNTPQPTQQNAAPAQAPSSAPAPTAPIGGFADRLKKAADTIGVLPGIGGWSKSLVASAVSALGNAATGLADASSTAVQNGGSGIVEGITQTLANRNARIRQQQQDAQNVSQRNVENEQRQQTLDLDKQRTSAAISEAQVNELHVAQMTRNEDAEAKQKIQATSQTLAQPFLEAGAQTLGSNLSSDDLNNILKSKQYGTSDVHAFQDGFAPVVDKDGNPVMKDGQQVVRPTWQLIGPVPTVTLDKAQADVLTKYSGQKFPVGTPIPGDTYYLVAKRAQAQQAVEMNVQKLQAEIDDSLSAKQRNEAETREKNLSINEKLANQKASSDFAPYLAGNNGDPVLALRQMANDPKAAGKVGQVEKLYGPGNIERFRQNTLSDLEKTIDDAQKTLSQHDVPGATPLPEDEASDLKQEIAAAKARRNLYLGLHPADPPQFADAVTAMDKVPVAQRQSYIVNATTVPPAAKVYLLKHYGLPVPPSLLPQPAPTAAPAR